MQSCVNENEMTYAGAVNLSASDQWRVDGARTLELDHPMGACPPLL